MEEKRKEAPFLCVYDKPRADCLQVVFVLKSNSQGHQMRKIPLIPYIYTNVNENSTNPAQKKNMQVNIKAKIGFTIT